MRKHALLAVIVILLSVNAVLADQHEGTSPQQYQAEEEPVYPPQPKYQPGDVVYKPNENIYYLIDSVDRYDPDTNEYRYAVRYADSDGTPFGGQVIRRFEPSATVTAGPTYDAEQEAQRLGEEEAQQALQQIAQEEAKKLPETAVYIDENLLYDPASSSLYTPDGKRIGDMSVVANILSDPETRANMEVARAAYERERGLPPNAQYVTEDILYDPGTGMYYNPDGTVVRDETLAIIRQDPGISAQVADISAAARALNNEVSTGVYYDTVTQNYYDSRGDRITDEGTLLNLQSDPFVMARVSELTVPPPAPEPAGVPPDAYDIGQGYYYTPFSEQYYDAQGNVVTDPAIIYDPEIVQKVNDVNSQYYGYQERTGTATLAATVPGAPPKTSDYAVDVYEGQVTYDPKTGNYYWKDSNQQLTSKEVRDIRTDPLTRQMAAEAEQEARIDPYRIWIQEGQVVYDPSTGQFHWGVDGKPGPALKPEEVAKLDKDEAYAAARDANRAYHGFLSTFAKHYQQYSGLAGWSSLVFNEEDLQEWRDKVNDFFCKTIVLGGIDCWKSKICGKYYDIQPARNGILYTSPVSGALRAAAHIEGQRSLPISTPNETYWVYTITFSIANPEEEGMSYNVRFGGSQRSVTWWPQAQPLGKGETASAIGASALMKLSRHDYTGVCLEFNPSIEAYGGKKISSLCNSIVMHAGGATTPYGPPLNESTGAAASAPDATTDTPGANV